MNREFSFGWGAGSDCDGLQAVDFSAEVDVLAGAAFLERSGEDALYVAKLFEALAHFGEAIGHETEHIVARSVIGMSEAEKLADVFDAEAGGLGGANEP